MPHPVLESAQRFRAQLLIQERQAATRLVAAYGRTFRDLSVQMEALQAAVAALESPSAASIQRLAALRSLRAQITEQVSRYAIFADQEIALGVTQAIELGLQGSLNTVQAYFANPRTQAAIAARWDMLASDTVEVMLGFTASDSPLRERLVGRLGPEVADRIGNALVDAIATGQNPRVTAAIFRREMGQGLTWSLNTARTAQIWAYREAIRANYMNNADVVSGWKWMAAIEAPNPPCLSCWAQHGTVHPVEEVLADHHLGRCVAIPIVPLAQRLGISEPIIEPGEDLFTKLPEAQQRALMGPAMHEAWKAGDFNFRDLSRGYVDPVYGDMLRQSTLREVVGEERARQYIDMGKDRPVRER